MKKYVVVSTTNNPDYYFYAPYIEKAWNSYGWDVCIMLTHDVNPKDLKLNNPETRIIQLPAIQGLRDASIAQAGRLYAANYLPLDALIMTSDMDLLPLKNYWNPDEKHITVFGYDLTWRSFYPMGYIAMIGATWKKYMNCSYDTAKDMLRDATETKIAFSEKWEEWWNFDWDLITKRLKPFEDRITFIDRGQTSKGLALGRIDRADWMGTQDQEWIDAHCENNNVQHPEKLEKFLKVFEKVYGQL